jgi:hypothetical protein
MAGTTAALALTAATSIVGAGMNIKSSYVEAGNLREQGDLVYQDYQREANQVQRDANSYLQTQVMQYTMAGVAIQGTPIHALQDTIRKSQEEANLIRSRGARERDLAYQKASRMQTEGVVGSLTNLAGTALGMSNVYNTAKAGGIFDSAGTSSHVYGQRLDTLDNGMRIA